MLVINTAIITTLVTFGERWAVVKILLWNHGCYGNGRLTAQSLQCNSCDVCMYWDTACTSPCYEWAAGKAVTSIRKREWKSSCMWLFITNLAIRITAHQYPPRNILIHHLHPSLRSTTRLNAEASSHAQDFHLCECRGISNIQLGLWGCIG